MVKSPDFPNAFEKGYWQKQLEMEKRRPPTQTDFNFLAALYAIQGDQEKALDALEKAVDKKRTG